MKPTSSQMNSSSVSSRSTRSTVNGKVEANHDDSVNEGQSKRAISPKKRKGLPVDNDETTAMDIAELVKAQGEEIAELKGALKQLTSKVQKQSQVIEGIKKGMRGACLSWQSLWNLEDAGPPEPDAEESPRPRLSTSGLGRGRGRPRKNKSWFAVRDLSKPPKKRGRPSKQQSNHSVKVAKVSSDMSEDDEEIEKTVEGDQTKEEPCSSTSILNGSGSGTSSGIKEDADGAENDAESDSDDEVKDTSFAPYKMKKTVSNLKSKLRKARLVRRNDKHRCEHCGKKYKSKGILKTHIRSIHEDIRYKCAHCPGTFAQFGQLETHRKLHAEGGPPLEKCKVCGMALNGRKGVMIHMATIHKIYAGSPASKEVTAAKTNDDPFKCQLCERTFVKKDILRYHLSKNHGISGMEAETILGKNSTAVPATEEMETTTTIGTDGASDTANDASA